MVALAGKNTAFTPETNLPSQISFILENNCRGKYYCWEVTTAKSAWLLLLHPYSLPCWHSFFHSFRCTIQKSYNVGHQFVPGQFCLFCEDHCLCTLSTIYSGFQCQSSWATQTSQACHPTLRLEGTPCILSSWVLIFKKKRDLKSNISIDRIRTLPPHSFTLSLLLWGLEASLFPYRSHYSTYWHWCTSSLGQQQKSA